MSYKVHNVKQEDAEGCGIACLAILANKTYKEVRDVYLNEYGGDESKILKDGGGLTFFEMQEIAKKMKLPSMRICNTPCIVNMGFHFVVVDFQGNVLDPAKCEVNKNIEENK